MHVPQDSFGFLNFASKQDLSQTGPVVGAYRPKKLSREDELKLCFIHMQRIFFAGITWRIFWAPVAI